MSLTAEKLAQEMKRLHESPTVYEGPGVSAHWETLAAALLPFIERHIAAGQQGITAEWVKGYFQNSYTPAANLQAVDDAFAEWAALHPTATPQPPKPAGAVPMPAPSGETYPFYGLNQLVAYGDAREAAGRAGAVPDGYCLMPMKGTPEIFTAMRMSVGDGAAMGPVYYAALSAGAIAASLPQQPAAEPMVFADTNPEAQFIADSAHLNCPACGGSGHIDDTMTEGAGMEAVAWQFRDMKWKPGVWADITRAMYDSYQDGNATGNRGKDWDIRALYDRPTPAADSGGVTVTNEMISRAFTLMRSYDCFSRFTHDQLRECISAWLTAALTPEVRNG